MSARRISHSPPLGENAARGHCPDPAFEADLRLCGLPPGLVIDWQKRFLQAFGRALERYRSFRTALESCVRCGACADSCPYHQGTGDPLNMPAARAGLARDIYERYFAHERWPLRFVRSPVRQISEAELARWFTYFHQCGLCRSCALSCPFGIDTSQVTLACREIMAQIGLAARPIARAVASCYRYGNGLGITPSSWKGRCESLERLLKQRTGQDIKCPVDQAGAEVLLIPPASDLTSHQGTFLGYARVFHAAGVSWTTSSYVGDADNPGLYLDYRNLRLISRRVLEAARLLKPQLILWGESGAGWWAAQNFAASLDPDWPREPYLFMNEPVSMLAWSADLVKRGALEGRLDKGANDWRIVTYHDPCHLTRSLDLVQAPRDLINASCHYFYELPAGENGLATQCCGGGGGLWDDNLAAPRLAAFAGRAQSLREIQRKEGCNWVATSCDQCKSALLEGMGHYGLDLERGGVHQLLGEALYPMQNPREQAS